jgi:hypothetical protein
MLNVNGTTPLKDVGTMGGEGEEGNTIGKRQKFTPESKGQVVVEELTGVKDNVLTPENWTVTIVHVESVRRGKHKGKATDDHTRVQDPGGAGRAHQREEQGRDLPRVSAEQPSPFALASGVCGTST